MTDSLPTSVWLGGIACLGLLLASLHLRRRQRLLRDLPTSKARGVFIGLVEVTGSAESASPVHAYLSTKPCVHYSFEVQERWSRVVTETYTDNNGKTQTRTREENGWKTVATGGETTDFYVEDDTGAVLVRPEGAKIEPELLFDQTASRGEPLYFARGPDTSVADSDHVRRFVERGIPLHAALYVVGQARERRDIVAPEIAADREAPLFLISTRTEKSVQTGYTVWSWVCWSLGLLPLAGGAVIAARSNPAAAKAFGAATAAYLSLWTVGWVWMAFNSLVSLRHRVRHGWSLVDVQLKRRHELIPRLVSTVAALGSHEQKVQATLAALRTQATATGPGVAGPDFDGVAGPLRSVIETYPHLTAQPAFSRLHGELVETEQRIALARTYYNDIATHFSTRLEQVPDRWVARLGRMSPASLLHAANFERASLPVEFVRKV